MISSSLIISVYKDRRCLEMILESVLRQSVSPTEVIVSEDGCDPSMRDCVEAWKTKIPQLSHLTQADQGNRKPRAMNQAIRAAKGDYLVFIDGDCVLRHDFIEDHLSEADENCFLAGRRVELSPKISASLNPKLIRKGYFDNWNWQLAWDALQGETHRFGRLIKSPRWFRRRFQASVADIRGCNFSVHKKHLLAINGFSNFFSGAYGEDSDVEYRLKFLGLKMKSLRGCAIQFHVHHAGQNHDPKNQVLLQKVLQSGSPRTTDGIAELDA
jgi:glycosyltransferase involved in cell wall biosynthesis